MSTPRKITFPKKAVHNKSQSILAVAWATQQQPGQCWESTDVSTDIANWLDTAGYPLVLPRITEATRWLADRNYAARVTYGQRVREFIMDPDVIVPEPDLVKAQRLAAAQGNSTAPAAVADPPAVNGTTRRPRRVAPPLPQVAQALPPWLADLDETLTRWWATDPAAADAWATAVITELGDL